MDPSLYQAVDLVLNNLLNLPEILDGEDGHQLLHYERGKSSDAFVVNSVGVEGFLADQKQGENVY